MGQDVNATELYLVDKDLYWQQVWRDLLVREFTLTHYTISRRSIARLYILVTTYILPASMEGPLCKRVQLTHYTISSRSIVRLYMVVTTFTLSAGVEGPPCKICHLNIL